MSIITLAELKTYLNITSSSDDTNLTFFVNAVNQFITTYTHRIFDEDEYVELYDGPGRDALVLRHIPVTEITSIIVGDEEVLERTAWGEEGYYYKDLGTGIIYNDALWERSRGLITVTYTAGYADEDIPYDLKLAALEMAAYFRNLRAKAGIISESLGSYSPRLAGGLDSIGQTLTIPSVTIKNILDRYREDYFADMVY